MRSTITPHPGLHSLYSTGSGGTMTGFRFARTGFATTFGTCVFAARLGRDAFTEALVRRAAAVLLVLDERAALVAITSALAGPPCLGSPESPSVTTARYLLNSFRLLPALHNVSVRALIVAGLFAQRRESSL